MRQTTTVIAIVLIAYTLACGGGGGGSKSPSAPPPPPVMQIAGSWSGLWFENRGIILPVLFELSQSGNDISGSVNLLIGTTLFVSMIEGRVSGAIFSWEMVTPVPTCDTMDSPGMEGNSIPNPTQLDGRMRLDGRGCGELFFGGRIIVERDQGSSTGSARAVGGQAIHETDSLREAAEALDRLER